MEIVNHPLCTKVLGAPDDMPEPNCEKLPVVEVDNKFGHWMISFWKPSKEELDVLVAGGSVALWVRTPTEEDHPVVGLAVDPY